MIFCIFSQSSDESADFISNQEKGDSHGYALDPRFDWCEVASDVQISEECKHKIVRHRSRSKVYEFSPRRGHTNDHEADQVPGMEVRKRYFPMTCCFEKGTNTDGSGSMGSSNSDESNSRDSFNTVEERRIEPVKQNHNQMASVGVTSNNLVEKGVSTGDSLVSEDQSDCKLTNEVSFFERDQDIPYIDESESSSSQKDDASQNGVGTSDEEETKTKGKDTEKDQNRAVVVHQESMKQVTWSGCLSTCACIPTNMNDSDSFSAYYASEKVEPRAAVVAEKSLPSGVDYLQASSEGSADKSEESHSEDSESRRNASDDNRIGGNLSVERRYTDDEDGIEFIEARLLLTKR